MELSIVQARALAVDVLTRFGLEPDHAGIVADHLVDAAAAGHAFAGLPRVLALVENLRERPKAGPIRIERTSPNGVRIDGGGTNGYVTSLVAIEQGIEVARESGVALVGIRNTWFSGRLAYYVERAARAGFITIHTASTAARVAPAGGIDRIFGTNPIAFGFPCDPDPLVIDFGTGMTTWGETLLRQRLGKPLDPGSAVGPDGNPTVDPTQALLGAFLPWGGHRGYGLSLVVQVLAILCGGKIVAEDVADSGFFFLLIDPSLLTPVDTFKANVAELVQRIESSRPEPGRGNVRVHGRSSASKRSTTAARGCIEVDPAIYERLCALRDGVA